MNNGEVYGFFEKWVSLNVPASLPSMNNGDVLDGFLGLFYHP
jgi:hypothetical protein